METFLKFPYEHVDNNNEHRYISLAKPNRSNNKVTNIIPKEYVFNAMAGSNDDNMDVSMRYGNHIADN